MELKSGEISPVIEDVNGYFIYKVGEKNTLPLDQVRAEISTTLRTQRAQQYMRAAEQSATTTLNEEYFTVPPPSAAPAMSVPRGRASGDQDALDGGQGLVQVGNDVLDVLDTH